MVLFVILYSFAFGEFLLHNSVKLSLVHLFEDFCLIFIFIVLVTIPQEVEKIFHVKHIWGVRLRFIYIRARNIFGNPSGDLYLGARLGIIYIPNIFGSSFEDILYSGILDFRTCP